MCIRDSYKEDRFTVSGLRGAVQAAVADAGLNNTSGWVNQTGLIPQIPAERGPNWDRFHDSQFGFHASSKRQQGNWGTGARERINTVNVEVGGKVQAVRDHKILYSSSQYGEAPENLLAVEHLATGANMPGWVMQADLLSPLAPVSSPRSDTFTIRVMGENNGVLNAKAWIELVVQRVPDYVKADVDSPHHRPHEPFKDRNLNGYWDNGAGEHWIDLNRNSEMVDFPDLPGVGELGRGLDYRDGMLSDIKLNLDPQEEPSSQATNTSFIGVNQRFGRKFKIVRFRWLRENDV